MMARNLILSAVAALVIVAYNFRALHASRTPAANTFLPRQSPLTTTQQQRLEAPAAAAAAAAPPPVDPSLLRGTLAAECTPVPDKERAVFLRRVSAHRCVAGPTLCEVLARSSATASPTIVLTAFQSGDEHLVTNSLRTARALGQTMLALALDDLDAAALAQAAAVAGLSSRELESVVNLRTADVPGILPTATPVARKWAALAAILGSGVSVLYADVAVVLGAQPFALLERDSDFSVLSQAWETEHAHGFVMGSDDPSMGWSRYCETWCVAHVSSQLFNAEATEEAVSIARRMAGHPLIAEEEAALLTSELLAPAHDAVPKVGASVRILHSKCWLNEHLGLQQSDSFARTRYGAVVVARRGLASLARARELANWWHRGVDLGASWSVPSSRLPSRHMTELLRYDRMMRASPQQATSKALVLASHCAVQPLPSPRDTRPLAHIAPPGGPFPVNCEGGAEALCDAVRKVAKERAVMAAVSNGNILQMLGQFCDGVQRAQISNFLVVALDERTASFLERRGVAHYQRQLRAKGGGTDNHATSSLKFRILSELIHVGCSVLLSDVDIVVTRNPFEALYRDTDVEGMSDGWDELTTYGFAHETPLSEAKGDSVRSLRLVARNSGLFYVAATNHTLRLMNTLAERVSVENVWDQSAYNQEITRLAHGGRFAAGVSVRTMNHLCFMNTKTLFKHMRYDPELSAREAHMPVTVHVNYHPEKEARMVSVRKYYVEGDDSALRPWNGGEGKSTGGCVGKVGVQTNSMRALSDEDRREHRLVKSMLEAGEREWSWREASGVIFEESGRLRTPSGEGTWGVVQSPWRKDTLHVLLGDETYLLMFLSEKWAFVALRCRDEEVSHGNLVGAVPRQRLVF